MGIFDKFFHGHLSLLFWVMGVGSQHDDRVSQRKKFLSVFVLLNILVEVGLSELPHNSFDLLGLTGEQEL